MKSIILFDMDGTLTPPRKPITQDVVVKLRELSSVANIGILTGSGYEYLVQQCKEMWYDIGTVPASSITLLPCNGTQVYKPNSSGNFDLVHSADMLKEIGQEPYKKIMRKLFNYQAEISTLYPDINFTGTFFQYRGSLLNWCPIGRIANDVLRHDWTRQDKEWSIRETYMHELQSYLKKENISVVVSLGGVTSFDIYPSGWDKTYALKHFAGVDCWFVGDSCEGPGNDRTIYEALKESNRSFMTSGPQETIEIIDRIISEVG